jgi:hypothetical protein
MPDEVVNSKPVRFRFHPLVRYFMIFLATISASYSIYFITILIPQYENVTIFFKIISVVVLYISLSTLYKHLTSLNYVIISNDNLKLGFLLKKNICIPWDKLSRMEIYKVITHYWKIIYIDEKAKSRVFKTSLAFPGIMEMLALIFEKKPDLEMNELLNQVLLYKRSKL